VRPYALGRAAGLALAYARAVAGVWGLYCAGNNSHYQIFGIDRFGEFSKYLLL